MPAIILLLVALVTAQDFVSKQKPFTRESLFQNSSVSLLDPSKFTMKQSYSMSFSTNGSENDLSGLYLNRMTYQFDIPLTLQVDVGLFHKPMALFDNTDKSKDGNSAFLGIPHARLIWQPSSKFMMSIEYHQFPSTYKNSFMPFSQ